MRAVPLAQLIYVTVHSLPPVLLLRIPTVAIRRLLTFNNGAGHMRGLRQDGWQAARCGRCRNVWFCNRECQVLAARQGHSANCHPADRADPLKAAGAAMRLPVAAGPSPAGLVKSASLTPAANSCDACGKTDGKLLRCGRCRNVWFCNRECQVIAARQGHSGVNCRPALAVQAPLSSVNSRSPCSAPLQGGFGSTRADSEEKLCQRCLNLLDWTDEVHLPHTRLGRLASVPKYREAGLVANLDRRRVRRLLS